MHRQRAEEIAHSPEMHHVTYNGKPIYIQHVDMDNQTALVSTLDEQENEYEVHVTDLIESKSEVDL
ncbi:H-type small acid-soluble spore protein [Salipaludibacillus daqingensis]|uniref:H-type small acid-soluble spore protein n=1 Tax=Salipaludibacillus daqingensis TaxID=3041001 RepID=UPI0024742ADB|nr:H-type small acid-soluble spore protein [Salipaludibacillus daqingensis]